MQQSIPPYPNQGPRRPPRRRLTVDCPPPLLELVPEEKREALLGVLAEDPRPAYQDDPERVYAMTFAGLEIKFRVSGQMLTICQVLSAEM